jgi:hypothetical protein
MHSTPVHRCIALLTALTLGYLRFFAPPHGTGSADANMLAAFKLDEFGQYRVLWRMTEGGDTLLESLTNLVCYDHYYYGFPFFISSALPFWPLRSAYVAAAEPGLTHATLLVLRQLSTVFMLLAIGVLTYGWTRFRSPLRAGALFATLAFIPAVVTNNLWWHPDSLATLFVAIAIVALAEDRRRLGRWFYVAAVACGLATGTKLVGLWFFLAVAVHLLRSRPGRGWGALVAHGAGFAGAMALAVVLSNPQLLVPGEAREVWTTLSSQMEMNAFGRGMKREGGPGAWYSAMRDSYGFWWTYLALLIVCVTSAVRDRANRDLAITTLAWIAPISLFLVFTVANKQENYVLPVLLPLAACAAAPWVWLRDEASRGRRRMLAGVCAILAVWQLGAFAREDVQRYSEVLNREETSASLAFHRQLEAEVLAPLPPGTHLRVFLDPKVYLRPRPGFETHIRWRGPEYADIEASRADLILLRQSEIDRLADPAIVSVSFDREQVQRSHEFHRDARNDSIPGFRRLLQTDFAVAFGRTSGQ